MIQTVSFENFKALRDLAIPLERFTVLVGPNASGKTSVLQGLDSLFFLRHDDPDYFSDERDLRVLRSQGAPRDASVVIRGAGTWAGEPGQVELSLFDRGDDHTMWALKVAHGDRAFALDEGEYHGSAYRDRRRFEGKTLLEDLTPAVDLLRLDATRLARPSYSASLIPHIAPDGEGLAAVLADMLISRPDDFGRIERSLRTIVPSVQRIRLERAPVKRPELQQVTVNGQTTTSRIEREYVGHRIVFDMEGASQLPAHGASEGTLIVLGILTAIMSHRGAHLVLLDDLERAIHPRAIADLIAEMRALLELYPDLQIVATSHSPYLVDHLAPEEVRLMIADKGRVMCAGLGEHPQIERWKEIMHPGEIWSMVGEEWVKERSAAPHA
jgi:energy-coupling factor transporter ATP-binding protein EcfA2